MEMILDLQTGWLVLCLGLAPAVSALLMFLVTQYGPLAAPLRGFCGVVPPFFQSVGILFALFAAFLGADIWQRVAESNHSLEKEVAGVQSIVQIARSLGPVGKPILLDVQQYVKVTLDQELSTSGQARSGLADATLEETVQEILSLPHDNGRYDVAQGAMLAAYESIWEARTTRRHIADTHSDPYKWTAVIFLGFLTQIALTLGHMDKPKPLAAALLIFTLAFAAIMIALGIHERPLADPALVSVEHLERIIKETVK